MLLNLRALAFPNHTRDMEMSTTTVRFSPHKSRRTTPDVTSGTVTDVYPDTLRCIPEEGPTEDDGAEPAIRGGD
jgi:hypothetical protein